MEDLSQLNFPLPVEGGSTASQGDGPKPDSDSALFEGMLAEAELQTSPASAETSAQATAQAESTPVVTTTETPSGEQTPDLLSAALEGAVVGSAALEDLVEEVASQLPAGPVLSEHSVETPTETPTAETPALNDLPEVVVDAPEAIEVSRRLAPEIDDALLPIRTDFDPSVAPNVELQGVVRDLNVGLVEETLARTGENAAQVPVRPNPETGRLDASVANRGTVEVASTAGSATPPTVVGTGALNPFVQPGDGKSLKSLDLETLGVTRIEITAENAGSKQTPAGQAKVMAPEAVSQPAPRPEPTLTMLGLRSSAQVSGNVSAGPGTQGQTAGSETVPVLESVDSATAAAQSSRPEVTTVSGAGLEAQVTSQYVLKEGTTGRRIATDSKVVVTEATPSTTEKGSTASFVQMTSEIPAETGGTARQAAPQPAAPAQPAKPANLPTFALEPARRVTMMVGESDSGVRIQLSENRGEVSVRFDAPTVIRTGLEGSVHNLVDSLNRQQVPLSDVLFSGRFDTGTDSGQSQHGDGHGSRQGRSADTESEEALAFMTEFESSDEDSLVSLTA